jgi:hypothetical protein
MLDTRKHMLPKRVRFTLFLTSFLPLFSLIILRQVAANRAFLHRAELSSQSIIVFFKAFGLSAVLTILALFGLWSLGVTMRNLRMASAQGFPVSVVTVSNRNAESISYIGTYIIPFLFEDYSSLFSLAAFVILFGVIYCIYVNSTLILINPVLSIWYSLYEVAYVDMPGAMPLPDSPKGAMILTQQKQLEEGDRMLFQRVGHKLFYATYAPLQSESHPGADRAGEYEPDE